MRDELAIEPDIGRRRFRPYPKYRVSGVEWLGKIPAHWECLTLSRRTTSRCDGPFGSGLKSEHYAESGVRVVRLQNIGFAEFLSTDCAFIPEVYADQLGDHSVRPDDILIAGLGDEGHPVGRACVAPPSLGRAIVKADCFRFRLNQKKLSPMFAAYQLSATAEASAGANATGATRSRMNLSATGARNIVCPPMQEQLLIVEFLERATAKIDALIAKKERLIELLEEKRAALITRAVTKGLDPNAPMKQSGIEWLGAIPAHWDVMRLKNASQFVTSGSRGWAEYYSDDGPQFLRIGNLTTGSIELNLGDVQHVRPPIGAEGKRTHVRRGDVLISITALIGAVGVVPDGIPESYVNQHLALVRPLSSRVLSRWLAYCILSSIGQQQMAASLYGGTKDGLGLEDVWSLVVIIPPYAEQEKVVMILDLQNKKIESLIRTIRGGISYLNDLRTALISAAVTGKIDVRDEAA